MLIITEARIFVPKCGAIKASSENKICVSNEKIRKLLVQQASNVALFYYLVNTKRHFIAHTQWENDETQFVKLE